MPCNGDVVIVADLFSTAVSEYAKVFAPPNFFVANDVSTKLWFSVEKDDTVVCIASGPRIAFEKTCGNSRNKTARHSLHKRCKTLVRKHL